MKNILLLLTLLLPILGLRAQVGIGTTSPDTSAMLEVYSTTKGMLIPRLTQTERANIVLPATGLLIYQTNSDPGFYYYNGSSWDCLASCSDVGITVSTAPDWHYDGFTPHDGGDTMTTGDTMMMGTSGYTPLYFGVNKSFAGVIDHNRSTVTLGYRSGLSTAQAVRNTFIGDSAGYKNERGSVNIFIGKNSGNKSRFGFKNVAIGYKAGPDLDSVYNSIAIGSDAVVDQHNTVRIGNAEIKCWGMGVVPVQGAALQVGYDTSNGNGAYLTKGGTWTNGSSRTFKDHIIVTDQKDILNKVMQLPIYNWRYKGTNEYHIGPIAEDFHKLFNTGIDSLHISTIDPAGIALAGIQEVVKEQEQLRTELKQALELIQKQQQQINTLLKDREGKPVIKNE